MTKWQGWLTALSDAGKGGVILQAADRGLVYTIAVAMEGVDYSGATFVGQVRSAPDATGDALATFAFTTPVFDADDNATTFEFSLDAAGTAGLPADTDGDGVEQFPFDILMTPNGEDQERLIGGLLPISGVVTQ